MSDGNRPQTLPCSGCGDAVDPLRAARVAVFGERFHYFCSSGCRERFAPSNPPLARAATPMAEPAPAGPARLPIAAVRPNATDDSADADDDAAHADDDAADADDGAADAADGAAEADDAPASAAGYADMPGHTESPACGPDADALSCDELGRDEPRADEPQLPRPKASSPPHAGARVRPGQPELPRAGLRCPELHVCAAIGLGALSVDLLWGAGSPGWLVPGADAAALGLLCWGTWRREELVWRGPALLALLVPFAATLAALGSLLIEGRAASHSAGVAGAICFAAATSLALVSQQRQVHAAQRSRLEQALRGSVRRPSTTSALGELRPGEEFLLELDDRAPADAVIVAGRALIEPWFESPLRIARQEGNTLLAGARVVDGAVRAVVRWAGMDRAWARLSLDPRRRADRHASPARLAERLSTTGALALGVLGALLAFSAQPHPALVLSSAAALAATLANIALPELVALQLSGGVYELLARGISFREPAALDRAAHTSAVVFCAEGTLFSDEPSVASIEPAGSLTKDDLLALLVGAFAGVGSPVATALQRCAQAYQVRPDGTRSPSHTPGLGVTAVASTGQSLVVGTRALLLGRRISVAGAEARIAELEALGRGVLLAALDGRYVGLVALQDGIAAGGRAAVQSLIDARVEAILLSGEARDTCKALACHLGIDHIRPEVAPEDRAAELRRLADSTPGLAVVGRASKDDAALGMVPLSINIDGAGGPLGRWDIDVASGDVRDAALAVHVARRLYADTTRAIVTCCAPALIALFTQLLGLPAWFAPIAGVTGSVLAMHRSRRHQTKNTEPQTELGRPAAAI
jgi:Cu+-exporting ATPase